jgi:hypothetical protein
VRSIHAKTFKDLAFQFGASVSTVIRRFDAVAKKELQGHPELPKVMAGRKNGQFHGDRIDSDGAEMKSKRICGPRGGNAEGPAPDIGSIGIKSPV